MKKRSITIGMIVAAILTVGVTVAFMFRMTLAVQNDFEPANVMCSVAEEFDGTQKTSIKVKNDSNIACYVRVRLISYWKNAQGEIVGKASEMPSVSYDSANWSADEGNDTYYYKTAVAPKAETEYNLLAAPIVLAEETFNEETVYQTVEVFAEAVQAEPADAVQEAWPEFKQ